MRPAFLDFFFFFGIIANSAGVEVCAEITLRSGVPRSGVSISGVSISSVPS